MGEIRLIIAPSSLCPEMIGSVSLKFMPLKRMISMTDSLLHERDAARILGLSVHWLRRARCKGGGPPYIKFGRAVRYELNALLQWIADHRVGL